MTTLWMAVLSDDSTTPAHVQTLPVAADQAIVAQNLVRHTYPHLTLRGLFDRATLDLWYQHLSVPASGPGQRRWVAVLLPVQATDGQSGQTVTVEAPEPSAAIQAAQTHCPGFLVSTLLNHDDLTQWLRDLQQLADELSQAGLIKT